MIPPTARFIWFGSRFPWVNLLALRSAQQRGGFERVVLHHDDRLDGATRARLADEPGVTLEPIELSELWPRIPAGARLEPRFARLDKANARANVVRAAILYLEGGVYLDMDTVTVRSLSPLREAPAFCGAEHVAWPGVVRHGGSFAAKALALGRDLTRAACAALPNGWALFRRVESSYPRAANNAVLGAEAGSRFLGRLLEGMAAVPEDRFTRPFALGTHLLQERLRTEPEVVVHPPAAFYPLGPEVSVQWFREGGPPQLDAMLLPETRVVHWYASVRTRRIVPRIDPDYVRARADRQPFSALAAPFIA